MEYTMNEHDQKLHDVMANQNIINPLVPDIH